MFQVKTNNSAVLLALLLAGPASLSHGKDPSPIEPTVRLTFDGSAAAVVPAGKTVEPLEARNVVYTDGLRGRALRAEKGIILRYPRHLLPARHGSVSMWVRLTTPLDEGGWRFFFSDGTHWGPVGMPRLWLGNTGDLRFDMDGGRRYFMRPMRPWPVGAWRHFIMAWDADQGRSFLYCNGQLIGQWEPPDPWQADPSDSFRVGSGLDLGKGNRPALADIDEITVYDRTLTAAQADRVYQSMELPVLQVRNATSVVDAGMKRIQLEVVNVGYGRATGTALWPAEGKTLSQAPFALAHNQSRGLNVSLAGKTAGFHAIPVTLRGISKVPDQLIEAPIFIRSGPSALPDRPMSWQTVGRTDCVHQPPAGQVGKTTVVHAPIGGYLEAGPRIDDRVVYAFKLSGPERLVRVTVTYPDDKVRTMGISNWGPPQEALGSGIACGDTVPLTGKMATRAFVFFSPKDHVAIVFSTEGTNQPAAVAALAVEEAPPEFTPAASKAALGARKHRRVGLYWEDPVLARCFGQDETVDPAEFERVLNRCMDYGDWLGLGAISYPAIWFVGPIYRSEIAPGYPMAGRNHPPDYPDQIARWCQDRGYTYFPSFNVWRLGQLRPLVREADEVIAGKPSINCVDRTGRVVTWGNHNGFVSPMVNILHPSVQKAIRDMVREVAGRCARHDSFGGIDFLLWPGCFLSPQGGTGTDNEGSYDDYSVGEFARAIGQTPPGKVGGKDRFVARYRWIMNDPARKAQWIRFRCRRLTEFYHAVGVELAAIKPGAKLGVGVYDVSPAPRFEGRDVNEILRASGIDVAALAKDPNLVVRRFIHQMSPRYALRSGRPRPKNPDLVNSREFNDFFNAVPGMGAIFHQQYFETPLTSPLTLPVPLPRENNALVFNAGIRVTEPLASGRECLRSYACALRNFDPVTMTVGGYVLGTQGIEPELREFTRAFSSLPAVAFKTVSEKNDIVIRQAMAEGKTWTYAINVSATARPVSWPFHGKRVTNAVTGQPVSLTNNKVSLTLRPYELIVFQESF